MTKILFQRILPSYRIPVFRRLYELFGIITCYSDPAKGGHITNGDEELKFKALKINRIRINDSATLIFQNTLPVIHKYNPDIVISEGSPSYLTLWSLLFFRFFFRYKIVIWSHGIRFNEIGHPFQSFRSRIQLWLFNRADAVIIYSDDRAKVVREYIKNKGKVFVARNTLNTDELNIIYEDLKKYGKRIVKEEIDFMHTYNLVYIGRLLSSKGIEDLISAFELIRNEFDIALHIVGDGPEMDKLIKLSASVPEIYFHGAIFDSVRAGKFLYSSDLMVIPGYVGLSVIHSFAFGCPVVTYLSKENKGPLHSPEVEYIKAQENGVFCSPDPDELARTIRMLLQDKEKLTKMSENAAYTAYNDASIVKMMEGFRNAIKYLEGDKNKSE